MKISPCAMDKSWGAAPAGVAGTTVGVSVGGGGGVTEGAAVRVALAVGGACAAVEVAGTVAAGARVPAGVSPPDRKEQAAKSQKRIRKRHSLRVIY